MKQPSTFNTNKIVGVSPGQSQRALVVNVQDPLKAGRVQIRITGMMDNEAEIPDDRLPWVKVRNDTTTASLQTSTTTHGLLPGSMVTVEGMGQGGQDYLITGTIPNDLKDDNQTIHPATQGKGETDNIIDPKEPNNGFDQDPYKSKSTRAARMLRSNARKKKRTKEPIKQAEEEPISDQYGNRSAIKDGQKSGTIGTSKFSGKSAQQAIEKFIQNKSAIVPNGLSAIQNLMKVNGNPTSIDAIGKSNYSAILSQLANWFKSNGSSQQEKREFDCDWLLLQPDFELDEILLEAKRRCELIRDAIEEV